MHLAISWWVIYNCTCPHHAEYSAVFDQKQHDPHAPYSPFTRSHPKWHSFVSPDEKSPQRETVANVEEVKRKTAEALKTSKSTSSNTVLSSGKKSRYVYCIKRTVLWRWLKLQHVRINTQFFIEFHFGGVPLVCASCTQLTPPWLSVSVTPGLHS